MQELVYDNKSMPDRLVYESYLSREDLFDVNIYQAYTHTAVCSCATGNPNTVGTAKIKK